MKQKGINRDVLRLMFGDDVDLFKSNKQTSGTGIPTKMKRILVWPNITFDIEQLERDSYVQTIYKMISGLNGLRDDMWWELVMPLTSKPFELFDEFNNVDVVQIKWLQNIQTTRGHFDKFSLNSGFVKKDVDAEGNQVAKHDGIAYNIKRERNTTIGKTLDSGFDMHWKYWEDEVNWNFKDIDLIFSHLPESTWNLVNYLGNEWHHIPPILGYCHWFDVKEVCNWQYPAFIRECEGISLMKKCYVNTESQKKLVLKNAEEHFSKSFIEKLDEKIEPYHLPVSDDDVVDDINEKLFKTIAFNHRTKTYKDFKNFILKVCDPLWEKRQDFTVWIPLLDLAQMKEVGDKTWKDRLVGNHGYIDNTKHKNKVNYHNYLSQCSVGFSPKQKYNGWSVATTDGMMTGVPYVMFDADYYHELNPTADYFTGYDHAIDLLEKYLDDVDYRNKKARESLEYTRDKLRWSLAIDKLSNDIDEVIDSTPSANPNGDGMQKVLRDIKEKGEMTKRELITQRWGSGIKFTPYRRALMEHPNVMDKHQRISTYKWVDEKDEKELK